MRTNSLLLFFLFLEIHCFGILPFPFVTAKLDNVKYENVPEEEVLRIIEVIKQKDYGKRQLQFLQYYSVKRNTKLCFVYSKEEEDYAFLDIYSGISQDKKTYFIQIPKNAVTKTITYCCFNEYNFSRRESLLSTNYEAGFLIHELHHYCEEIVYPKKNRLNCLRNYEINNKLIDGDDKETHQQLGCWFIGEFDALQEYFNQFVFRIYYPNEIGRSECSRKKLTKISTYLRNHQLDSNFIRPKYYEYIVLKENGNRDVVNTIAFLQQEDFLLEHFALEVPSDGNDAIWAIMQAMFLEKNFAKDTFSIDSKKEYNKMLYWRSRFCETAQKDEESVSRFSENHCRIKVEDFKYIAQTIQRDIIVIEPADIHFKINVFNSDGTNYTAQKLPKWNAKTLYIYYNGYNHYQPLLLSSKLDKTISLEKFLDQPQNTLSNFLNTKHFIDFVETKFLNRNYKIQDVSGNGNCGIYAILRNLGLGDDQNIALRNAIFPQNHRMCQDRAWLGMEDLHFVASYLGNAYQRDLIIVNTSPINPNVVNVITPDDHVYTRYVNGRWVRYDSLVAALNQESENTNPPVILLYTPNHWQAVLPERRAIIGNVGDSNGSIPKKRRLSF